MQAVCVDQPSDLPAAQQQLTPPAVASSVNGQAPAPYGLPTISLDAYQATVRSLTRGPASVQPVSMKEKALHKMSDLKQVRPREESAAHSTDLSCTKGNSHSPPLKFSLQVLAVHGCSTGSKTKQVCPLCIRPLCEHGRNASKENHACRSCLLGFKACSCLTLCWCHQRR